MGRIREIQNKSRWKNIDEYNRKARARNYNRIHDKKNACSWCGSLDNLHFHHTDYDNRTGFTLCRICHGFVHKGIMLGGCFEL